MSGGESLHGQTAVMFCQDWKPGRPHGELAIKCWHHAYGQVFKWMACPAVVDDFGYIVPVGVFK